MDFIRAYLATNKNAAFATSEGSHVLIIGRKIIRTSTLEKMESNIRKLSHARI